MTKKLFALLMVVAMLCMAFVGCKKADDTAAPATTNAGCCECECC